MNIKKIVTTRNLIIAGGILAAGIIIYLVIRNKKRKNEIAIVAPKTASEAQQQVKYSETWPIRLGSGRNEGEKAIVRNIQKWVNVQGIPLTIDGSYGTKTQDIIYKITGKKEVNQESYNKMLEILTGKKLT